MILKILIRFPFRWKIVIFQVDQCTVTTFSAIILEHFPDILDIL